MYKSRLNSWGFGKYASRQDWLAVALLKHQKRAAGIDVRKVQIHNRERDQTDFEKYLKQQNVSEADLLSEAMTSGVTVPDHVHCVLASAISPELNVSKSLHATGMAAQQDLAHQGLAHNSRSGGHENILMQPHTSYTQDTTQPVSDFRDLGSVGSQKVPSLHSPVSQNRYTDAPVEGLGMPLAYSPFTIARESIQNSVNLFSDPQSQPSRLPSPIHDDRVNVRSDIRLKPSQPQSSHPTMALLRYLEQAVNPMTGIMPTSPSYTDITRMVGQVPVPHGVQSSSNNKIRVVSPVHHHNVFDDPVGPVSAQAHYEAGHRAGEHVAVASGQSNSHDEYSASLLEVPVGDDQSRAFMKAVMMACMSGTAGDVTLQAEWLSEALNRLRTMCKAEDTMLLVTVNIILVWLEVHDAGPLLESLMRALFNVTAHVLGNESPITCILEWTAAAAGKKLPSSHIDSDALRRVARDFSERLGPEHPHTIVALYYMCFHMMCIDKRYAEAEEELKKLYSTALKTLGPSSFQTICVLATLSRAQSRQKKYHAALETINRSIRETPLGLNHPHRLELLVRKALICWKLRDENEMEWFYWDREQEQLYWFVFRGRVATLGRYHKLTKKAYDSLVQILKENGRWDIEKGRVQQLLTDPQVATWGHECWWRCMVPRDREGEVQRASSEETE
jgi:hypothetical protein